MKKIKLTEKEEDFQLITFDIVPIDWIKKMYPNSWKLFEIKSPIGQEMKG